MSRLKGVKNQKIRFSFPFLKIRKMWKNSIFWIYDNCILLNQYYCRCLILEPSWRVAVMALLLVTCIGLNNWSLEARSKIRLDISQGKFKSADSAKFCSFFKNWFGQILLFYPSADSPNFASFPSISSAKFAPFSHQLTLPKFAPSY